MSSRPQSQLGAEPPRTVSGHVEGPLLAVTLYEDASGVVLKLGSGFFSGGVKSGPFAARG